MKKRYFLYAIMLNIAFLCFSPIDTYAQFVLTPSDGLVYPGGAYTINRNASVDENIQAAENAIKQIVPTAVIEKDSKIKNRFTASANATIKMGKSGARAFNHNGSYTVGVEASEQFIKIRFLNLSQFEHEQGSILVPWKSAEKTILNIFIFKSDGSVRHKKAKLAIEDWANNLVLSISQAIQ